MRKFLKVILFVLTVSITLNFISCGSGAGSAGKTSAPVTAYPVVTMNVRDFGTIKIKLYPNKAPNTVNNFIYLIKSGFYDGLIFHRIISGFMIQGGDPNGNGSGGPGYSIKGEFSTNGFSQNDIKHVRGVVSMARGDSNDSAGSQFFIVHQDGPNATGLDGKYAAFGKVIEGMDVVDKIAETPVLPGQDGKLADYTNAPTITKVSVDTFGADYTAPVKIK